MGKQTPKGDERGYWVCELCFEKIEAPASHLPGLRGSHREQAHGLRSGDSSRNHGHAKGWMPKGMFTPSKG